MKKLITLLLSLLLLIGASLGVASANDGRRIPTIDDLLTVKTIGGSLISPDGKWVVYAINETDFKQDAYVMHAWLVNVETGKHFQLTRGDKSVGNVQWSPDSMWVSFTSNRVGDKNQIFVISPEGGEAIQLTKVETNVGGYAWSRDGKTIAFTATEAVPQPLKDRKEHMGDFEVVRKEYSY
ncbi:MAG TPA: DPP IV N-terminal domain-containing protein, partial [Blastocatellia bacterium]